MSHEDRETYTEQRPQRLVAAEAARKRSAVIFEMAQVTGIPRTFGGGAGIQVNPVHIRRLRLAEEVYDNGCQADVSGECGPCERFDIKLCQVLGEIATREE